MELSPVGSKGATPGRIKPPTVGSFDEVPVILSHKYAARGKDVSTEVMRARRNSCNHANHRDFQSAVYATNRHEPRRVHRSHEHKFRRKSHAAGRARDGHPPFLQGLAHGLQNTSFEFGQFVEEQNSMMRERDLARGWVNIAAEQAGIAGGWQRCLFAT